jgi:peroxiredoxin
MKSLILTLLLLVLAPTSVLASVLQKLEGLSPINGTSFKVDPQAKDYVVVFLSAKCPCSDSHIPELKALAEKFKDVQFIGVHSNLDETKEMTESYFKNAGLPFTLIHDPKGEIADDLKAYKTPHAFVLSHDGEILYQGGVTNSSTASKATEHFLQAALSDLKEGRKIKVSNGRTLGCVISREKTPYVW